MYCIITVLSFHFVAEIYCLRSEGNNYDVISFKFDMQISYDMGPPPQTILVMFAFKMAAVGEDAASSLVCWWEIFPHKAIFLLVIIKINKYMIIILLFRGQKKELKERN